MSPLSRLPGHHLILGGCGFIGRHVAALLARAGQKVVLASRTANMAGFAPDILRAHFLAPLRLGDRPLG